MCTGSEWLWHFTHQRCLCMKTAQPGHGHKLLQSHRNQYQQPFRKLKDTEGVDHPVSTLPRLPISLIRADTIWHKYATHNTSCVASLSSTTTTSGRFFASLYMNAAKQLVLSASYGTVLTHVMRASCLTVANPWKDFAKQSHQMAQRYQQHMHARSAPLAKSALVGSSGHGHVEQHHRAATHHCLQWLDSDT